MEALGALRLKEGGKEFLATHVDELMAYVVKQLIDALQALTEANNAAEWGEPEEDDDIPTMTKMAEETLLKVDIAKQVQACYLQVECAARDYKTTMVEWEKNDSADLTLLADVENALLRAGALTTEGTVMLYEKDPSKKKKARHYGRC